MSLWFVRWAWPERAQGDRAFYRAAGARRATPGGDAAAIGSALGTAGEQPPPAHLGTPDQA